MSSFFKHWGGGGLFLGLMVLCASAFGENLEDKVRGLQQKFDAYTTRDIAVVERVRSGEMVEDFREGLKTLVEVSGIQDRRIRTQLLLDLSEAMGKFYDKLTEPFADVAPPQPTLEEISRRSSNPWFINAAEWAARRTWGLIETGLRDLIRVLPITTTRQSWQFGAPGLSPISVPVHATSEVSQWIARQTTGASTEFSRGLDRVLSPLMGRDTRRADTAGDMADALNEAIFEQFKTDDEQSDYALAAYARVLNDMDQGEPSQNRLRNIAARWSWRMFAVVSFFHPWIYLTMEHSNWAPLVNGTLWLAGAAALAHSRTVNSGLRAADRIHSTMQILEGSDAQPKYEGKRRRWGECKRLLSDAA